MRNLLFLLLLALNPFASLAFVPVGSWRSTSSPTGGFSSGRSRCNSRLEQGSSSSSSSSNTTNNKNKKKKRKFITLQDATQEVLKNPAKYLDEKTKSKNSNNRKKSGKSKRTRQRVENPQQSYAYKSQRRNNKQQQKDSNPEERQKKNSNKNDAMILAKELGLVVNAQHCDVDDETVEPILVERISLMTGGAGASSSGGGGATASSFAYVIDKPAGWSIMGKKKRKQTNLGPEPHHQLAAAPAAKQKKRQTSPKRQDFQKSVKVLDDDDSDDDDDGNDVLEYNELDVMALLTEEELEEYLKEEGNNVPVIGLDNKDDGDDDDSNKSTSSVSAEKQQKPPVAASASETAAATASFRLAPRPSIVAWLQEYMEEKEGMRVKGGKAWKAVAGATQVDDSGLVLLFPRGGTDVLKIKEIEYTAVVGTGGAMAKVDGRNQTNVHMELAAKLKKGRDQDIVNTVRVIVEGEEATTTTGSTCDSAVEPCQSFFKQGIRGDPAANPLDRRARRRLLHCSTMELSTPSGETLRVESAGLPDDISLYADRRHDLEFSSRGSFLGRTGLRNNPQTTAYREVNGAADSFPGWNVDRYADWLFVQHDPKFPKGPLPSIHDGNTAGVYYLESNPDRSSMGSDTNDRYRPTLLEGKAAPDVTPILENGITYLASLHPDLSTGIFLDQRPQRMWLSRNCGPDTRVMNCFAHTGAFSVAAATAGASTVSLDLSRKWLDRLPEQLVANGVSLIDGDNISNRRHDCIYGDCFDWMSRLSKRGEKYDIVILDPPSSSVGGRKKKRWSVKNDMDELVELACGLVKKGGLLWTTTNSASISPTLFARILQKGFEKAVGSATIDSYRLERIQPMPTDYPSIGPQPVKNYVWRLY